jgi:Arc/MetJ-type ribon-helix-helix transcriptional regulator
MKRTNIYLGEELTASLDNLAEQEGISRAELIRTLLDRILTSSDDNLAADLQVIDESFGALRDLDLSMRRPGDREKHLDRTWHSTS